ncbi:MAG TPA: PD-(D/E)XK nuclease family protein, partial [Bryobacteraceae bacterium]|nr:PD-(D/E)XK nuclease family protein [Bryobacteraceae bacterium]
AFEKMPLLGVAVFDHVFEQEIARARVPRSYRTESVRLRMLHNFENFLASRGFEPGWEARVEQSFEYPLTPEFSIRGRIDRLEISPSGDALVIDYKYSAPSAIRDKVAEQEQGSVVQAGLYLLVAEKQFGFAPAGMLYAGLRDEIKWGGWHIPIPGLQAFGESCTRDRLSELTSAAESRALAAFESILSGEIEPRPANEKKCVWCDSRDICRIETR